MTESLDEARDRYLAALHAMQSGVAMEMNYDPASTTPKHLRVGVNSAMSDTGALAKLLVDKGVITEQEYYTAVADGMERERDRYTRRVQDYLGPNGPTINLA